jgi:hypothetical protein
LRNASKSQENEQEEWNCLWFKHLFKKKSRNELLITASLEFGSIMLLP